MSTVLNPSAHARALAWKRYAQGTAGPVATAAAHFALSLSLLHTLSATAFGQISFLLITVQLGTGLWSALFCAPLPVLLAQAAARGSESVNGIRRCILTSSLAACALASLLLLLTALALDLSATAACLFAVYAACFLLRWIARADAYALGYPLRSTASDLTYGAVLGGSILAMWTQGTLTLDNACVALLASALSSLFPFGRNYLLAQFLSTRLHELQGYARIWRAHSRWALAGVLSTEATTNSHAYFLTLAASPAALAPIAASALLTRPLGVIVNAVQEFERPRIAAQLGRHDPSGALASMHLARLVLRLAWLASALAAAAVMLATPELVFPPSYDPSVLVPATVLWMLVALVRQGRAPESTLLQAAGEFRSLAQASIASSLVSVVAVAALFYFADALWTIGGLLAGEMVCTLWTWRQARRFRQQLSLHRS